MASSPDEGLMNGREFLGERGQHIRPVVPDDDEVLDPDPAQPAQVDAGLDGDDVPAREHVAGLRREPRRLVDEQADAVPEPVAERLAEPLPVDPTPRDPVHVLALFTDAYGGERLLLRRQADLVRARELVGKRPCRERARAVRAVAVDDAAGVDDDRLPGADRRVPWIGVRLGAVRAGGDDSRERNALGAELVKQHLDPPGEGALRAADELLLRKRVIDAVRDPGRRPDGTELRLVLDRAEPLHEAAARNELGTAGGERLPRGVRERARLEADPAREQLG